MEQINLLGIHKGKRFSTYVFPKEQQLFEIVRTVLRKLNFNNDHDNIETFGRLYEDQESEMPNMEKEEDIREYAHKTRHFQHKEYSLDIIFFPEAVILIFNYLHDKQQEIAKAFEGFIIE